MTELSTTDLADAYLAESGKRWVFKHSAICPTSHSANAEVAKHLEANPDQILGMVVVQNHRPVSNHLAQVLGYVHQSPQLFLVEDGKVLWNASHWGITASAMAKAWDEG